MIGICYYIFVVQPKKQLEEASSLRSELSVANPVDVASTVPSIEDFDEFEKKYRIVKCKNDIISNYLKKKIGYESVHEELQKVDLVTGERKESAPIIEPLKRPSMGHIPSLIGETYEESLISSGLVYLQTGIHFCRKCLKESNWYVMVRSADKLEKFLSRIYILKLNLGMILLEDILFRKIHRQMINMKSN